MVGGAGGVEVRAEAGVVRAACLLKMGQAAKAAEEAGAAIEVLGRAGMGEGPIAREAWYLAALAAHREGRGARRAEAARRFRELSQPAQCAC